MKARELAAMSMFTALIIVGTFIHIPMPICPITFQPVIVALAGIFLGARRGALSAACYVFIGLIGVPVFTGGGGLWYVFQPTFGFLAGYIIQAFITGKLSESGVPSFVRLTAASMIGLLVMYAIGVTYFGLISVYYIGNALTLKALLVNCLLIPLPKDTVLCVLAAALGKRCLPVVKRFYGRTA